MCDSPNALNEDKFQSRLCNLIDVVRNDGDLSIAEVIGILEIVKLDLHQEQQEDD